MAEEAVFRQTIVESHRVNRLVSKKRRGCLIASSILLAALWCITLSLAGLDIISRYRRVSALIVFPSGKRVIWAAINEGHTWISYRILHSASLETTELFIEPVRPNSIPLQSMFWDIDLNISGVSSTTRFSLRGRWLWLSPLVVATTLSLVYGTRYLRIRNRKDAGRCAKCGYDLQGNTSGVCPECGTPLDNVHSRKRFFFKTAELGT